MANLKDDDIFIMIFIKIIYMKFNISNNKKNNAFSFSKLKL